VGALLVERLNILSTIQACLYTVDRCAQTMWRWCTDRVAVLHVTYYCSVNGVSHVTSCGAALTLYICSTANTGDRDVNLQLHGAGFKVGMILMIFLILTILHSRNMLLATTESRKFIN